MKISLFAQLRRGLFYALRMAGLLIVLGAAALFIWQDHLIWFPRTYAKGQVKFFPRPLATLAFHTAQGSQTVFYVLPRDGRAIPSALWVLFAGNGTLALDWDDLLREDADPGHAFLLVDYPGYGRCEGKPSPASIRENAAGAMDALARHLGQADGAALTRTLLASGGRLAVLGHSMGTGAALEFAASQPAVSRVVLVSPFTSLRDAARGTVGWPLNWLLRGNFDNRARLAELAARSTHPDVLIFHGDQDTLVPPWMGRSLAVAYSGWVRFESVHGAGHDDVVSLAQTRLLQTLDAP